MGMPLAASSKYKNGYGVRNGGTLCELNRTGRPVSDGSTSDVGDRSACRRQRRRYRSRGGAADGRDRSFRQRPATGSGRRIFGYCDYYENSFPGQPFLHAPYRDSVSRHRSPLRQSRRDYRKCRRDRDNTPPSSATAATLTIFGEASASPAYGSNVAFGVSPSSSSGQLDLNGWQLFGHSLLKELQSFANTLRDFDDKPIAGCWFHGTDGGAMLTSVADDCAVQPPVPPPRRCRRALVGLMQPSRSEPNLTVADQWTSADQPHHRTDSSDEKQLSSAMTGLTVLEEQTEPAGCSVEVEVSLVWSAGAGGGGQPDDLSCTDPTAPDKSGTRNVYYQYPCPFVRNGYNSGVKSSSCKAQALADEAAAPAPAERLSEKTSKLKSRSRRRSYEEHASSAPPIQQDKEGHLLCKTGDVIMDKYLIVGKLGEGTFGRVFEVVDVNEEKNRSEALALKVIRNKRHYRESARAEIDILRRLNEWDHDGSHLFIRLLSDFDYYGHACLVFPKHGMSVFDFMKANSFAPYPLEQVRHIAYQLCHAVKFMHDHGMVHTDLKPENMIFVTEEYDVRSDPVSKKKHYRVMRDTTIRLIDFGATVFDRKDQAGIVSTRHYRAPEVILELGWSYPCDVWSIGCIVYELVKGVPMFQVHEDLEHLAMMQRVLGTLPAHMLIKSKKFALFEYGRLPWDERSSRARYIRETLEPLNRCFKTSDPQQEELFSLITEMLQYPPSARVYLGKALRHRFFRRLPQNQRLHELAEDSVG